MAAAAATTAAPGEAPKSSSSGSADSYIGSLISLTSKSEIRYEGVLFNINTEESSIGLRNVRSFGTEGRKKDGLQVPPSDKVYEYILFRGSDIKDLQVKSSPVQTTTPVHNDPAIIQTHYPQAANTSTSLPSSGTGSTIPDLNASNPQMGLPRPPFQANLPLYQPVGSLGSWGSTPTPPTTNGSGLALPMYWQGFYGSSNGFQLPQQSLLRPPPGLSMPPSMQQTLQYPAMNTSLPSGASNSPALKSSESPSALLPPLSTGILNLQSSFLPAQPPSLSVGALNLQSPLLPAQPSAIVPDTSSNLIPNKVSTEALPTAVSTAEPLVSPLTTSLDRSTILSSVSDKPVTVPSPPVIPLKPSESSSNAGTSSSIPNEGAVPSLVTPNQLLQSGPTAISSTQPSQSSQRDVEVVQVSSSESLPSHAAPEAQEPILPLPSSSDHKLHGAHMMTRPGYRGGRERGRGNRISRPLTRFTEDFDFTAMNEKFNKDEVWDDLGKSKALEDGNESQDEDDIASSKNENKPVYVKDDFFDSLSCDALDAGSHNGRTRFSDQLKKDTETFGYMPRYRGGRGGRGPGRGGRSGGYYGRGYGYVGRGRGHSYSSRGS
ncbi:protein decapping 5 [Ziziphus jujuba]|uniref:Protein decapping 5 n=1 Tax=Ziziphus jujuba TaxID=326968 RepID=A0A6P3ZKG0_ZIZJJ|nr:protein decapping 5 [Ziziphus jujuba]